MLLSLIHIDRCNIVKGNGNMLFAAHHIPAILTQHITHIYAAIFSRWQVMLYSNNSEHDVMLSSVDSCDIIKGNVNWLFCCTSYSCYLQ